MEPAVSDGMPERTDVAAAPEAALAQEIRRRRERAGLSKG